MSEVAVEIVEVPMTLVEQAIEKVRKQSEKNLEQTIKRMNTVYETYEKLKAANVPGLPKLDMYGLTYGFTMELENPRDIGLVHKAIGKLVLNDKKPVEYDTKKKGRKKQEIILHLCPPNLSYYVTFKLKRKLLASDKCKVSVVTRKEIQVVCGVD